MPQQRRELWPDKNFPSAGWTGDGSRSGRAMVGEVAVVVEERPEESESVLGWRERRRKGIERTRKVGKRMGVGCGLEGLRKNDIATVL